MNENTINADVTMGGDFGTLLAGRYRVVRQLGQGGMGSVWLAEDTKLDGFKVAIKMLPSVLVNNKRAYAQVKAEALVSLKLSHLNIATVRAFEEENGNPFLVMDYIDGQTLDDYLAEKGKLTEEETVRLLKPVAAALDYAHSQGVVHRDVKPGNVMIRKDGTPFVLDFGIAREIQETMTRVTGKLSSGTLLYMSPEQLNGDAPKPAQDIYSFAAMAYECLKGEPPFSRGQIEYQIVNNKPEPLDPQFANCGPGVMAGLEKLPENRPASCSVLFVPDRGRTESRSARPAAEARCDEDQLLRRDGGKGWLIGTLLAVLMVAVIGVLHSTSGGEADRRRLHEAQMTFDRARTSLCEQVRKLEAISREDGFGSRMDAISEKVPTGIGLRDSSSFLNAAQNCAGLEDECRQLLFADGPRVRAKTARDAAQVEKQKAQSQYASQDAHEVWQEAESAYGQGQREFVGFDFEKAQSSFAQSGQLYEKSASEAAAVREKQQKAEPGVTTRRVVVKAETGQVVEEKRKEVEISKSEQRPTEGRQRIEGAEKAVEDAAKAEEVRRKKYESDERNILGFFNGGDYARVKAGLTDHLRVRPLCAYIDGLMKLEGIGCECDYRRAIQDFLFAGSNGIWAAQVELARLAKIGFKGDVGDYAESQVTAEIVVAEASEDPIELCAAAKAYVYGLGVLADGDKANQLYLKASKMGSPLAMSGLGLVIVEDFSPVCDINKCVSYLNQAMSKGLSSAGFALAVYYNKVKNKAKSDEYAYKVMPVLQCRADQGDLEATAWLSSFYCLGVGGMVDKDKSYELAQISARGGSSYGRLWLGRLYRGGVGTAVDHQKAMECFGLSAEDGRIQAVHEMACSYFYGFGCEKNMSKAYELFEKCADRGLGHSMTFLGKMFWKGEGLEKNLGQAIVWLEKAAERNAAVACADLSVIYSQETDAPIDYEKARRYAEKGLLLGEGTCAWNLGCFYARGEGVARDAGSALKYYLKGVGLGDASSMNGAGICYLDGVGTAKDYAKAKELFEKAVAANCVAAYFNLGLIYSEGKGVAEDKTHALSYFEQGARLGDVNAGNMAGVFYLDGRGVVKNYARAYQYLSRASQSGLPIANYNLGLMYKNGWGVEKNDEEARRLFEKAAAKGCKEAKDELEKKKKCWF